MLTTTTEQVAAIRTDLAELEDRINDLVNTLDYRNGSSVSYAVDHLRIAAQYLDYAPDLADAPHDLDAPHLIPEDFAV